MILVVATRNAGKLKEIRRLLQDEPFEVKGLGDLPPLPEIIEDGGSFAENAEKKARTIAQATGCWTLADDSGLEVEALGGKPGIHSARFAGEGASDGDNNSKLLALMEEVPAEGRQAAFVCALALCPPLGDCQLFHGRLQGRILFTPRGQEGFGYDPLFLVAEYGKTLAELPMDIKNRISHRGQALARSMETLRLLPQGIM